MEKLKKESQEQGKRRVTPEIRCSYVKMVPLDKLEPHPENPNTHGETQIAMLADIIMAQGWRYPIVVSKRSGYIISGHGRWLAAKRDGLTDAPVDFQDFESADEERQQLLADNRIPELATRDIQKEAAVLHKLQAANVNTMLAGYKPKEMEDLLKKAKALAVGIQPDAIPAMELQPHEHYDYIVLIFKEDYDWVQALQALEICDVDYGEMADKKRVGLGRVIDGTRFLQRLRPEESDSEQGSVGHDQNPPTRARRNPGGNRRRKAKVRRGGKDRK